MTTIGEFLANSALQGGLARPDVWALGCHVLDRPLARLLATDQEPLAPADERHWLALIARRREGWPLSYLVGHTEFWSLPLAVAPAVLVPRPETEVLVEEALAGAPSGLARCLDLGTGSGAIALALKSAWPQAWVVACDASLSALAVARQNARRLDLDIAFLAGDWLAPFQGGARFDLIASNPPYIASDDPALAADGVRFEPRLALDGGPDGLRALAAIVAQAGSALNPGGRLLLEHGFDQGPAVQALLRAQGFRDVATRADYAGHARVTTGRSHG